MTISVCLSLNVSMYICHTVSLKFYCFCDNVWLIICLQTCLAVLAYHLWCLNVFMSHFLYQFYSVILSICLPSFLILWILACVCLMEFMCDSLRKVSLWLDSFKSSGEIFPWIMFEFVDWYVIWMLVLKCFKYVFSTVN